MGLFKKAISWQLKQFTLCLFDMKESVTEHPIHPLLRKRILIITF